MKSNLISKIENDFREKFDYNIQIIDKFLEENKNNEVKINKFINENCGQYLTFLDKLKDNLDEALPVEKSKYRLFNLFMNRCYNSITNDFEVNFKSLKLLKTEFILGLQNNYIHCINNDVDEDKQIECIHKMNNNTIIYVNSRIVDYYQKLDIINAKINKHEENFNNQIKINIDEKKL